MKQRYNDYSHELAVRAAIACFERKWTRRDVLTFIEEYAGIDRSEIYAAKLTDDVNVQNEACEAIACLIDDMMETILSGHEPEEVEPVAIRRRPDGMTQKIRDIACLCLPHQLLEHVAKLGLEPLMQARILPTQHASIPGHGQTMLKKQTSRALRQHRRNIVCFAKTDNVNAYGSVMYSDILRIIEREIPSAKWILALLRYLGSIAPGGHLIIGGYLDAWLYNLVMSYALRHVLSLRSVRRGKQYPLVSLIPNYMDDCCLAARSTTAAKRAIKALSVWLVDNLGLHTKQTTGIIKLCSEQEERSRRRESLPSKRACPGIDMGGYVMHRTYTTIRPRVFKRVARCFLRAWKELQETGTIRIARSRAVLSRYGFIDNTDSRYLREKYHVEAVFLTARRVCAWHNRQDMKMKRRFYTHAAQSRIYYFA